MCSSRKVSSRSENPGERDRTTRMDERREKTIVESLLFQCEAFGTASIRWKRCEEAASLYLLASRSSLSTLEHGCFPHSPRHGRCGKNPERASLSFFFGRAVLSFLGESRAAAGWRTGVGYRWNTALKQSCFSISASHFVSTRAVFTSPCAPLSTLPSIHPCLLGLKEDPVCLFHPLLDSFQKKQNRATYRGDGRRTT